MKFTKMQSIGNDYIYVDCINQKVKNPENLALKLSDRHFGIGADGLVLIKDSEIADFKMEIYNCDGTQAEMGGNAIRCVGKYVYDNAFTQNKKLKIETLAGIKDIELFFDDGKVNMVKVDMGQPDFSPKNIPVLLKKEKIINEEIYIKDTKFNITCLSMGNPHTVVFFDDIKFLDIEKLGPAFENYELFPKKINTEFVKIIDDETIEMRVWERGIGETYACGTGACAAVIASVLNGYTKDNVEVRLKKGSLYVYFNEQQNKVFLMGETNKVYDGEIDIDKFI